MLIVLDTSHPNFVFCLLSLLLLLLSNDFRSYMVSSFFCTVRHKTLCKQTPKDNPVTKATARKKNNFFDIEIFLVEMFFYQKMTMQEIELSVL